MYENFKNAVESGVIWMTEIIFSDKDNTKDNTMSVSSI